MTDADTPDEDEAPEPVVIQLTAAVVVTSEDPE
jgi:hypothetical protein